MSKPLTPEQEMVAAIKAEIAKLPPEQQARVEKVADNIRRTVAVYPGVGHMALALVGAEFSASEE